MTKRQTYLLYGQHAVLAALANPLRRIRRLISSGKPGDSAFDAANALAHRRKTPVEIKNSPMLSKLLPSDAVHQGMILEVEPLEDVYLEDATAIKMGKKNVVLVLDQLTDPHNVGAIFRSAAAFGVKAIITQDRHSPAESGALAKAASGALEIIPWIRVVNVVRTLDALHKMGYWRLGLDSGAQKTLDTMDRSENIVLALGAEGKGLRPLTLEHCDLIVKIKIQPAMESLNVSAATAIALYALTR